MKDQREVLTRNIIQQKLIRDAKRSMMGALFAFIFGAIALWGAYLFASMSSVLVDLGLSSVIPWLVALPFTANFFFILARALLRLGKARHGDFTVFEDTVEYVDANKPTIHRRLIGTGWDRNSKSYFNHIFQFTSGKKFVANSGEYANTHLDTAAQFAMGGDTYFTVFYNDAPKRIILLYSSKFYDYKE